MKNSNEWNKNRLDHYKQYYEKYYYGTLLFNKVIVQNLESQIEKSESNYNRLLFEMKKNGKYDFVTNRIFKEYSIKKKKAGVMLDISPRFENLTNAFISASKTNDLRVIDFSTSKKFKRYLYRLQYNFFNKEISNIINKYEYKNLRSLLSNDNIMSKLNDLMKNQVYLTAEKLKKDNIKMVIITDTLSTRKLLLVEGSKVAGVPCYSVPHGYPQTKFYHPLIASDKILVWNQEQKERLSKDVNEDRISIFGYPRYDEKYIIRFRRSIKEDDSLITYVTQPEEDKKIREEVYNNLKKLKEKGFSINIRLHPKELESADIEEKRLNIERYGFTLSKTSLLNDILKSKLILGEMSSVLYEALLIKNNSIQIIRERCEGQPFYSQICSINVNELNKLADENTVSNLLEQNVRETLINDMELKANAFLKSLL